MLQAEINTWVVLSVALPGMTSDPNIALPAAAVGGLLAIGTAGLTVSALPCDMIHYTSAQSVLASLPFPVCISNANQLSYNHNILY